MGDVPAVGGRRRAVQVSALPNSWVARWKLWQLPGPVLTLVIAVHVVTVGITFGTAWLAPVTHQHWVFASVLLVLGVAHLELSRGIERHRAKDSGAGPYHDLKTVWNVAALLLLPPILATAVIVATHGYGYLRIFRADKNPHRWAYSCATVVLASQAAMLLLAVGTGAFPGVPTSGDWAAWAAVFVAVFVRWLINYMLIIVVSGLMRQQLTFKDAFVQIGEQITEAAATALAILAALLLANGYPILLVCVYVVIGVLQQTSYYHHWKRERPFDHATGLYLRMSFIEQAQSILDRARFRGDTVGVLLLDIDHFKAINDTHGHLVGDRALVAVADMMRDEIRGDKDIPGRWGGEEFVVLLPDVSRQVLGEVAERIRRKVGSTPLRYPYKDPVTDEVTTRTVAMTVSIGAALYPEPDARGEMLLELIERADLLMYAAKRSGRNRVCSTLQAGVRQES